ncbi:TonB-dependent receptor family protein [Riemerella anatipestifer]|uniref:TonB-dependent receptor n=1 Tax=Riemerella anatipestifer TaxID=34085 RepID=A0AAP6HGM9_RIEAN|nr:TonB-dependent receptor [Riemerella anatipestifer]MCO7355594.1 TonB-dependent receptor [Riemerella anatipestifer]MCU7571442.1 TonB-dependent receptor [Riemerella anatipestifer]MCW0509361.1 TonB-dependent receptor [Riemerella anatipestifer]MDW3557595.1 TonB-dependent receptor [Riemerella anatipestifer]MDY3513456.1 TonB-dependent receptor [Riemerella anatipestifer]
MKKQLLPLIMLVSVASFAQETDSIKSRNIDEVVIQSQTIFTNKDKNEKASSFIYIGAKELQKYNYSDANRVLMGKTGIHVVEEEGFGLRPNVIIRGASSLRSSSINLMEDGVLAAPAPYVAPAAYYFPTMGRMAGVEILKSSGQIMYGPNTIGGSMNMLSTQVPNKFSGFLNASYGSFNTYKVHTHVGDKIGKFGYLVEYFTNNSDGFKELPNGKNTGFALNDGMIKLLYDNSDAAIPNKLQLKFQASKQNSNETYMGISKRDFNRNAYQRYLSSELDNIEVNQRQYLLSYQIEPSKKLHLNFDAYRNEVKRNWYKVNDVKAGGNKVGLSNALEMADNSNEMLALKGAYNADNTIYIRHNDRDYISQGLQFNGHYHLGKTGMVRFGARYHYDSQDRFQADDEYLSTSQGLALKKRGNAGSQDNRIEDANATASYLQYQQEFGALVATAGVRYENITLRQRNYGRSDADRTGKDLKTTTNKVESWIPGLSLLYKINDGLKVFGSVHKGFSPPGIQQGQKEERSWNYELGTRFNNNFVDAELIGYINDYSNLLGADTNVMGGNTGQGDLYNVGEVLIRGIEAQLRYTISGKDSEINFPVSVNYTYIDSSFKKDFQSQVFGAIKEGDALPFIPKEQLSIEAGANIKNFRFSAIWRYRGDFSNKVWQGSIPEANLVPSMNILDASISYKVNRNATVYANAQNLLNQTYLSSLNPSGYRPGMPRFVNVGVRISL